MGAALLTVIRGEDDDGVVRLTARFQGIQHSSDVAVNVEDAVEVVVDVVVPHVAAVHRDPAVVHVTQALVVADCRRLALQVIEEGGRQGRLPFLLVERRVGRIEDREEALDLDRLLRVGVEEHHVVRVDEVHGHEPRRRGGDVGSARGQPVDGLIRDLAVLQSPVQWAAHHVAEILVLGEAVGFHRVAGPFRGDLREVPLALVDGVVAELSQHVADGGQGLWIGPHVVDPGEVGVVEHAGLRRMSPGVHHRSRGRTHGGGAVVLVERHSPSAKAVPVGQREIRGHWLVCILLIGHDHENVGLLGHDSFSSVDDLRLWPYAHVRAAGRAARCVTAGPSALPGTEEDFADNVALPGERGKSRPSPLAPAGHPATTCLPGATVT